MKTRGMPTTVTDLGRKRKRNTMSNDTHDGYATEGLLKIKRRKFNESMTTVKETMT